MIVRIYDFLSAEKPKFSENLVGIVSDVTKFKYTRRAYDIGSFEMEVPTHANDAEYIQPDRMLIVGEKLSETYISGDPTRRIVNGTFLYVTEVDKNDQTITVTGYDLKYLFASRVTLFPAEEQDKGTYGYYVVSGTTFSCISNLINYNIVNATDSDRQIFGMSAITMPTTQVDAGLTGIQDDRYMTRLEPLSTAIFNLLKNCKTHFYDVRLLIDDNADDADNYNPHLESSEDKPTIIIDESRYNIKSYTRKDGTSAYKNAIYAVSGTGDDVVVKCVKREGDTASGIKRKEVVLDVDTDSVSEIDRYAIKAAEDYNISDDFEIEPLFDEDDAEPTLAQKVLIRIDGVDYETVITEITDEYSDGKHTQSYVCGDKKLKVLNVLNKATAGNTQKIINNKISISHVNGEGEYVTKKTYLYNTGDECTALTGGWDGRCVSTVSNTGSFTKNADSLVLVSKGSGTYCFTIAETLSSVDFSGFEKLKAEVFAPASNKSIYCDFGISVNPVNDKYSNTAKLVQSGKSNDRVTLEIDLANYQSSYYISLLADIGNTLTVYKIWLEKTVFETKYIKRTDLADWAKQPDKPVYTADEVGAAAENHNHTVADITDMPDWAKADTKPTYTAAEVGAATSDDVTAAINAAEIGGTQILKGTNTVTVLGSQSHKSPWKNGGWRAASAGTGTRTSINVTDAPEANIKLGWELTQSAGALDICQDDIPIASGQTYTASCYARGTGRLKIICGKNPYQAKYFDFDNAGGWIKCVNTFVASEATTGSASEISMYFGNVSAGTLQICGMKLETGSKATGWNEAPISVEERQSDLEARVAALEAAALSGGE